MLKTNLMVLVVVLVVIIVLGIYFASSSKQLSTTVPDTTHAKGFFSIASWNLQIFGPTKASNNTLLMYYAEKLGHYDLFVIQEIRDASRAAVPALAEKLPSHRYILSERAGQSTSKEQYAIFYDTRAVLVDIMDWTEEEQNNFERPPFEATFTVNNWTFTLYTIHTKPTNTPQELTSLEHLVDTPTTDTIVLGDMNADGDYYYNGVLHNFLEWHWLITSDMDTTVAMSSNAYDRILINNATENNFVSTGIMADVTSDQSDHYLIYAVFNPDEP